MKKGKILEALLLAASLSFGAFCTPIAADDYGESGYEDDGSYEDDGYEDEGGGESETEHPQSYYGEIQSNLIEGWPEGEPVNAAAAIVMDADTSAILYAKDIGGRYYPASITKIMTTLLALENGKLDDVVTFSEYAVYSIEYGSSHLGMTEGEKLTLEQCLYGIMLASANEISNAVAEHIGGDVDTFVQMMNDRAAQLGCTNTHFVNPHGLHDENHYTCAKDMALIMQAALKNEKFREIIGTVEYQFPETNLVKEIRYFMNHHKMIAEEGMLYDGCIGGKNGYTDEAYNTLVTSAERDGQTLIAVVLKAPGQYVSYEDTKVLLDYGFSQFKNVQIPLENADGLQIEGLNDPEEEQKVKTADFRNNPAFEMLGSVLVTLPEDADESALEGVMDFASQTIRYTYSGQEMGSLPFVFTGEWETEAPTETETETQTESETQTEKAKGGSAAQKAKGVFDGIAKGAGYLYGQMDAFIENNTVVAVILGAVLLLIFVPLLLVAVNRHRKYLKILELREEDLKTRSELEAEIERKSAAQVEAELRARELEAQLKEEKEKRRKQEKEITELENADGFYLDEDGEPQDTENEAAPSGEKEAADEDEYIEIPLEDGEEPLD